MRIKCCLAFVLTVFAPTGLCAQEIVINVSASRMNMGLSQAKGPDAELSRTIDEILERGFKLSGIFEVLPSTSLLPGLRTEDLSQTNFEHWYASGAQVLVKAQYQSSSSLDFALYDVSASKRIALAYQARSTEPRKASYDFVNAVIRHFTGEPGFMGQTLLATARGAKGQPSYIVRMTTDGRDIARVARQDAIQMLPAWGPSGGVMFTSYQNGNPDLYIAYGSTVSRLSSEAGMNTGASYCAGNGRIALTLSKDGNSEIYTMNSSGGDKRRLTQHKAIDTSPSWSPDCSQLAFVSDRGGNPQIYVMNADGSGVRRLTMMGKYNTNPAWGRGGKIAFSARDENNGLDIFVIDATGSNLMRLTQDQGKNDKPSWSPDGRYLAFSSTRDGGSRIYIATADGRSQQAVSLSGWYENPVWAY